MRSESGGYLHEDFRLFHLKDSRAQKLDYHYHEFDKLIFAAGREGHLCGGGRHLFSPALGHAAGGAGPDPPAHDRSGGALRAGGGVAGATVDGEPFRSWRALDTCFTTARERGFHLLRFAPQRRLWYMDHIQRMEEALREEDFGAARMADTLCQQLLIAVNRDILRDHTAQDQRDSYRLDAKMEEVLRYIARHLEEELTVDALAGRFYISRYYLMHRFKAVTGYTLHQYISQKRLLRAGS